MKPFISIFITNRVASNLWNDERSERDTVDVLSYMIQLAEKIPPKKKKLPLINRYALWIYNRAYDYLDRQFKKHCGEREIVFCDVSDMVTQFELWYFAKYIQKILERRKKHEKAVDEVEG